MTVYELYSGMNAISGRNSKRHGKGFGWLRLRSHDKSQEKEQQDVRKGGTNLIIPAWVSSSGRISRPSGSNAGAMSKICRVPANVKKSASKARNLPGHILVKIIELIYRFGHRNRVESPPSKSETCNTWVGHSWIQRPVAV